MMNSYMRFKTNSKKLQFGEKKCKKMHVGQIAKEYKCKDLSVDKWTEMDIKNEETGELKMTDVCQGEEKMEEKMEER